MIFYEYKIKCANCLSFKLINKCYIGNTETEKLGNKNIKKNLLDHPLLVMNNLSTGAHKFYFKIILPSARGNLVLIC